MKILHVMFLLGLLILVVGIGLVSYVKDDSFGQMEYDYDWHWYEVKTKPYFIQGVAMISMGACLMLVWLFWYATQKKL